MLNMTMRAGLTGTVRINKIRRPRPECVFRRASVRVCESRPSTLKPQPLPRDLVWLVRVRERNPCGLVPAIGGIKNP